MKKILFAVCLICLSATFTLAEDIVIFPMTTDSRFGASTGSENSNLPYELYVVTDENGRSRTVPVFKIDDDLYVISGDRGKSTTILRVE